MSKARLEPEALRQALGEIAEHARPRPDCPPPGEIWAAVRGDLARRDAERVVDHLAGCLACAEAWDLTRDLASEVGSDGESTVAGRSWPIWLGAAAVLLLVLAVPRFERQPAFDSPPPTQRGGSDGIVLTPPSETVLRTECLLTWRGPEQAQTYALELSWAFEDDFAELPRVEIPATGIEMSYLVPAEILAEVPTGARLIASLQALRGEEVLDEKQLTVLLE
ncbi:MAG: hypothetical protein MI919_00410 [Holophagales bacterium]|nr:hypothetical protein [Holophagales bacterium]